MRILIGCDDFQLRTGMPLYVMNIAREFEKMGHEVAVVSYLTGICKDIKQYNYWTFDPRWFCPDVLLLNEPRSKQLLDYYPMVPAFNIIHSPRSVDEPILHPQVRKYVAVKKEDRDYILSKGIKPDKVVEIPIPVDFKHFRKKDYETFKGKFWDIASISTFDLWRKPMILDLVAQARKGKRVLLMGDNYGGIKMDEYLADPKVSHNLTIRPSCEDVRAAIRHSKCIASLFEGTVVVEAWAMGKPTVIYDLNGKVIKRHLKPPSWVDRHDVKNVARMFIDLFNEKWADIIIPHVPDPKNRKLLAGLMKSVPRNYNVIVAKFGGNFAQNCNRGAKVAKNKTLIFMNDDMEANPRAFWEMLDHPADICGARTIYPDGRSQWMGIALRWDRGRVSYFLPNDNQATIPSGGLFRVSRDLFMKLKFDEEYINGGEDQDFVLRALEQGHSTGFAELPTFHYLSQSKNRFKHCELNEARERKQWLDNVARIKKVFKVPVGAENQIFTLYPKSWFKE